MKKCEPDLSMSQFLFMPVGLGTRTNSAQLILG
jgi:hypothetical protein